MNNGLMNGYVQSLFISDSNIFAGTGGNGVFLSTDFGKSWASAGLPNRYVYSFANSNAFLFAGTDAPGVYYSTNNGINWNTDK